MDFQQYLGKDIDCSCGHTHRCGIEDILIGPGAVENLPELLKKSSYRRVCIIEDENTKQVLGDRVEELACRDGRAVTKIVLPAAHLLPDEKAIGSIITAISPDCQLILAVGSGTLNDLGRFVSCKLGIPYFIIGTAPSMDGYASNVAAMVTKRAKVTYNSHEPKAIIGDVRVMAQAPMDLIAAGVGDVLGKYVCLADWKISNLLTGEYYCEFVAEMVRESVEKVHHAAQTLAVRRDEQCITELMEGLVLSGIAMSYIGNSRPASGSEHHLSHFWEMHFLQFGDHGAYHGTKVGVGTVICLKLYEWLAQENLAALCGGDYQFDKAQWSEEIRRVYKTAAPAVIELEEETGKNSPACRAARVEGVLSHQEALMQLISALPKAEEIEALLEGLNAPAFPSQIAVDAGQVIDGCRYAKELRNRTGLLQLLHDLGLEKDYGKRLVNEFIK